MYNYKPITNSTNIPNDSGILDIIKKYNKDELQKLLDDDEKLLAIINSSSQIVTMEKRKEVLLLENHSIANKNKEYEPILNNFKQNLIEEYDNLRKIQQINEELRSKLESYEDKYSPNNILTLLMAGMAESEEQSEKCADNFMLKSIDIEKFIEDFIEKRNLYHERRIKVDQLQDIINNKIDNHVNSYSNYQQPFIPNANPNVMMSQPNIGFKY